MNPNNPIYIVSKGRWESRLTDKFLDKIQVPHFIVVEKQEYKKYAAETDKSKLLVLDPMYQEKYETCDNLGAGKSKGPGAARNFAWDHALDMKYKWHWVMDDNIQYFFRWNKNSLAVIGDGTIFKCMEDFVNRYANVLMAGPNYDFFIMRKSKYPPVTFNTRIYSCNLIRNDAPYFWRCRYNEDTILSLDMLKDGWCTVLFNAFQQKKTWTQQIKGGNTAEFYAKEGTFKKSEMQVKVHPDVSKLVKKFGRWHHYVDYRPFKKNKLKLREGIKLSSSNNEYGMILEIKE